MPGRKCRVAVCKNNYYDCKYKHLNVSFFGFPKDIELCRKWMEKCSVAEDFKPALNDSVCSEHFEESDFEKDLQSELLGLPLRKILKKNAVPSRNLQPGNEPQVENPRVVVDEPDENADVDKLCDNEQVDKTKLIQKMIPAAEAQIFENIDTSADSFEEKYLKVLYAHEVLQRKYEALQKKNHELEEELEKFKKEAEVYVRQIDLDQKARLVYEKLLNNCFSQAQRDILMKTKKNVHWTSDDLSNAFTLRYLSRRAYSYLRSTVHYPLPHLSTLQKWASKIKIEDGTLTEVLAFMKIAGMDLTERQKLVTLQYDEIKVRSEVEYDKVKDQVKGPHNYMQVVMVRGLFQNYKQPIYVDFDQTMNKTILDHLISELHCIGYKVVGCVADCGGGNVGLWGNLAISPEKSFFEHPVSKEKIHVFADIPHLFKLVRNWLLDTGFLMPNGKTVTKQPLLDLIDKIKDQEVSIAHKLTPHHVTCRGTQRQNVRLAAELLSHTTATALLHYFPNDEAAESTGLFIEMISNWFDVFNSYTPKENLCTKKPYGIYKEQQDEVLEKIKDVVGNMRCIGKSMSSLQIFQKGILISTASLKNLYDDLKDTYGITYIITSRLNQDSLESMFSHIRIIGGLHDHPSPLEALQRMKCLLLGKNPGILQQKTNYDSPDTTQTLAAEESLVSVVLKKANVPLSEPEETQELEMSSSSSDTSSNASLLVEKSETEEDGFKYLCGWIARKFRDKYPELGMYTKDLPQAEHKYFYSQSTWIQHLSFGGLTEPSEEWVKRAKKFEKVFVRIHKDYVCKQKRIVEKITGKIKRKHKNFPQEVIKAFVLQRTYIRIKHINAQNKVHVEKRKASSSSQSKVSKKMQKIVR